MNGRHAFVFSMESKIGKSLPNRKTWFFIFPSYPLQLVYYNVIFMWCFIKFCTQEQVEMKKVNETFHNPSVLMESSLFVERMWWLYLCNVYVCGKYCAKHITVAECFALICSGTKDSSSSGSPTTTPTTPTTPGGSKLSPGNIFKNFFKCVAVWFDWCWCMNLSLPECQPILISSISSFNQSVTSRLKSWKIFILPLLVAAW